MSLRSLTLLFSVALLSACGTQSKIVTTDDSADYHSARSIPPLKKVNVDRNTTQTAPVNQPETPAVATVATNTPQPEAIVEPAPTAQPLNDQVAFRVVQLESGQVRMQLDANPNDAWAVIDKLLIPSDITVHSKNQVAGRFAIACEGIEEEAPVVKKGGWSFFNRKTAAQEYCSIKLIDVKGGTFASVFNKRGAEVSGTEADGIFTRLLNPTPED